MNLNDQIFGETADIFFPKWRSRAKWRLVIKDVNGADGRCDTKNKLILLASSPTSIRSRLILVHELVHAVAGEAHGKRFLSRLTACVKTAGQHGMKELASLLEEEVALYTPDEEKIQSNHAYVYNRIQDVVSDCPTVSFENVMDHVRREFGYTREKFRARFKRARQVYDEAQ